MNPPKMPLHIGDYRRDTGHLRAASHGAYLLLLMHYWSTGDLPDDDDQLSAIACMSRAEWRRARPILERFFDPGWKHDRIDLDLASAKASYERRASAGKSGGDARASRKQRPSNATALLKQPLTYNQEEEDGDGDARARGNVRSLVANHAYELTVQIAEIAGLTDRTAWPPGWCGAPMRVQAMLDQGWKPEIMLAAARATMMKKRDGPPDTINYFEKAFAREHARQASPLPTAPEGTSNGSYASAPRRGSRDDTRERLIRAIDQLDDYTSGTKTDGAPAGGEAGASAARRLSPPERS
jgi:uncharacterized protein YdaU (DUF1376 family)